MDNNIREAWKQTEDNLSRRMDAIDQSVKDTNELLKELIQKSGENEGKIETQQRYLVPIVGLFIVLIMGAGGWAASYNSGLSEKIGNLRANADTANDRLNEISSSTKLLVSSTAELKSASDRAASKVDGLATQVESSTKQLAEVVRLQADRDVAIGELETKLQAIEKQATEIGDKITATIKGSEERTEEAISAAQRAVRDEVANARDPATRELVVGVRLTAKDLVAEGANSLVYKARIALPKDSSTGRIRNVRIESLKVQSSDASDKAQAELSTASYECEIEQESGTSNLRVSIHFVDKTHLANYLKHLGDDTVLVGRVIVQSIRDK